VKVYLGQTRSRALIEQLTALGFGEMVSRGELPPRRTPWAYDNGAFSDWRAGRPFDAGAFIADLDQIAGFGDGAVRDAYGPPDFIVLPDLVAGGARSLETSLAWIPELLGLAPLYLAVQDGMEPAAILEAIGEHPAIAGVFVGGTLTWKLRTIDYWTNFAHACRRPIHVGRFGTPARVEAALRLGVDSIDSALPLWSRELLEAFVTALAGSLQIPLPLAEGAVRKPPAEGAG